MSQFRFDPTKTLFVGVERECFVTDFDGNIVPRSFEILSHLNKHSRFGYELSACQIEERTDPVKVDQIRNELLRNQSILSQAEAELGFKRLHVEVGPEDMPLDVYPDPSGRYQVISASMSREVLLSACRIIGTHIHVGMPDRDSALRVYNSVVSNCQELSELGDYSSGQRLEIYRQVAPDCDPAPYQTWYDFHSAAVKKGFDKDPRKCWSLIRISKHGTIEFRMFGSTPSLELVETWAKKCHKLCAGALLYYNGGGFTSSSIFYKFKQYYDKKLNN